MAAMDSRTDRHGLVADWIRNCADSLGVQSASLEAARDAAKADDAAQGVACDWARARRAQLRAKDDADYHFWGGYCSDAEKDHNSALAAAKRASARAKEAEQREPLLPLVVAALRAQGVE